ncbi:MAG TPA: DUF1707 domain-containing protein [Solirubrobacteraceae bacterium]|nr:DUF1707 domain-containing protein [Solirubrobacteraceae bacterium]
MSRHGALRASDADRDHVIERLHGAATEGRIASDELEQRVTAALRARTYAELDATTADLPGPGRRRDVARRERSPARTAGGYAVSAVRSHPALLILAIPVAATAFALMVAATVLWAVLATIVLVLGGQRRGPHPPWAQGWRHASAGWTRPPRGRAYPRHPGRPWG